MSRLMRRASILAAVAAVAVTFGVAQAEAGWHHWARCYSACYAPCYSYACNPCYTPCYSACYTPRATWSYCDPCCDGWYLGVRRGPIRRFLFGHYRWYRTWDCCGVCGYDPCCCTTTTTWYGDACGAAVEVQTEPQPQQQQMPAEANRPAVNPDPTLAPPEEPEPQPAMPQPKRPAPQDPATQQQPPARPQLPGGTEPAGDTQPSADEQPALPMPNRPSLPSTMPDESRRVPTRQDSGLLTIWVPVDAEVTINGQETQSQGTRREYVSYGLKPGFSYKYVVRAEVQRDGRPQVETKTIYLTAGTSEGLAFGFTEEATEGLAMAR